MSDLDAVAAEFKKWKGNLSYCRYPAHLWDKAHLLTEHYPLQKLKTAYSGFRGLLRLKLFKATLVDPG
jgi:hypothetical protein